MNQVKSLTYTLSRTVSKLLQIIDQICVFDREAPVFNTLDRGELLNSGPRNLPQEIRNIALSYILNRLGVAHE